MHGTHLVHGPDQGIIVGCVPDGDTDEFPAFKSFFPAAILNKDGVVFQQKAAIWQRIKLYIWKRKIHVIKKSPVLLLKAREIFLCGEDLIAGAFSGRYSGKWMGSFRFAF